MKRGLDDVGESPAQGAREHAAKSFYELVGRLLVTGEKASAGTTSGSPNNHVHFSVRHVIS
jgi:hypothetical protein